jgi:hypothetical protein
MTAAERYDAASEATNKARTALKATVFGRLWYWNRHRYAAVEPLLRLPVRSRAEAYDRSMRAQFFAMAEDLGLPVLTTGKPS